MAAVQVVLAKTGPLSPWKGGGFGMFASLDGGSNRALKVLASVAGRREELAIPASLEYLARKAEIYPTDRRLDDLAERIGQRELARGREVEEVNLEVWRIDFAPRTLDPTWRLLNARSATVSAAVD